MQTWCQRALTVVRGVWGDVLELAKRAVTFEHLRDLGDALDGVGALAVLVDPT